MSKITPLDRLFITVTQNGIARYFTELTGVSSLSEIIHRMRETIPGLKGLTTITVRNTTCGWNDSRSLLLR